MASAKSTAAKSMAAESTAAKSTVPNSTPNSTASSTASSMAKSMAKSMANSMVNSRANSMEKSTPADNLANSMVLDSKVVKGKVAERWEYSSVLGWVVLVWSVENPGSSSQVGSTVRSYAGSWTGTGTGMDKMVGEGVGLPHMVGKGRVVCILEGNMVE